jgi:hypothetical protein
MIFKFQMFHFNIVQVRLHLIYLNYFGFVEFRYYGFVKFWDKVPSLFQILYRFIYLTNHDTRTDFIILNG